MEFRNRTREKFCWATEDDLDGLLYPDHGSHPELAADSPGLILEEDVPGPVSSMETKILDPNVISAAAATNSGITNTTGLYDDSNAPTSIFTINPKIEAYCVAQGPQQPAHFDGLFLQGGGKEAAPPGVGGVAGGDIDGYHYIWYHPLPGHLLQVPW